MKSIKLMASALALVSLALTGCQEDEISSGIDSSKPAATNVALGEVPHTGKTLEVTWDAKEAIAAGARTFTVELVQDEDGAGVDTYESSLSASVEAEDAKTSYSTTFTSQVKGNKYYVRVRANYPRSIYSEWSWLKNSTGQKALVKIGRGIITTGIEEPYLYKVTPTSKSIIVKWDAIDGATGYTLDYKQSSASDWTTIAINDPETEVVKIPNLPSETSYDIRMKTIAAAGESDYAEATVTTRQPGSYPTEMSTADEFTAWLEGGVVEVESTQTFKLTADIDMSEIEFEPQDEPLLGTFDGNGYVIRNLKNSAPLFYQNEGTIKNVKIASGSFNPSQPDFGSIVYYNKGTVENCENNANISYAISNDEEIRIGGLVSVNEGTIKNSVNKGSVEVTRNGSLTKRIYVAGVAALSDGGLIENTDNNGAVSLAVTEGINGTAVAGIAGYNSGSLLNCNNTGDVTESAHFAGGFGPAFNTGTNNYNRSTPSVAGIVAYGDSYGANTFYVENCNNSGKVSFILTAIDKGYTAAAYNRTQIAGIVANPWGDVKNCQNDGEVNISVKSSSASAYTTAEHILCVGGIAGADWYTTGQKISNIIGCTNNGNVKIDCDAAKANSTFAGIFAWPGVEGARDNYTKDCVNNGNITVDGTSKCRVGGIHGGAGNIDGCINNGKINVMNVNVGSAVGGVAGFHSQALYIQNSENNGDVNVAPILTGGVGGFVGNQGNAASKYYNDKVECNVSHAGLLESTGMFIGLFNGTSQTVTVGTEAKPIKVVGGTLKADGNSYALSSSNYKTYFAGTKNTNATTHPTVAYFEKGASTEVTVPTITSAVPDEKYIVVSWDAINKAAGYEVQFKEKESAYWTIAGTTTETTLKIEDLDVQTEYEIRVRTVFESSNSDFSDIVEVTTLGVVIPGVPTITSTDFGSRAVTVKWGAVDRATSYSLQYKKSTDSEWTAAVTKQNVLEFTITGLSQLTSYDIQVRSHGTGGDSDWSGSKTGSTIAITYPLDIATADDFISWLGSEASGCMSTDVVNITADLDFTGKTVVPAASFAGQLKGNSKSIKNLSASAPLFTTMSGSVENLVIDATCSFSVDTYTFGIIAGENTGTISNIVNNANVTLSKTDLTSPVILGAIVGSSTGALTNLTNNGEVKVLSSTGIGASAIGGVVGYLSADGSILTNNGAITMAAKYANAKATIGAKTNVPTQLGGIVGLGSTGFSLTSCNNSGKIVYTFSEIDKSSTSSNARLHVGGIAGAPDGNITSCNNSGEIDFTMTHTTPGTAFDAVNVIPSVGGISGGDGFAVGNNATNITNCKNTGKIVINFDATKSNAAHGGIVGWPGVEGAGQTVVIKNCINRGDITLSGAGKGRFGGVAGGAGNLDGCKNYGTITNSTNVSGGCIGGVEGYSNYTLYIRNCENYGDIINHDGGDKLYTGGLLGAQGGNAATKGEGCKVKCKIVVDGTNAVNGLILGRYNGDKAIILGSETSPVQLISGSAITFGEDTNNATSENWKTLVTGTYNGNEYTNPGSIRKIYAEFKTE